MKRGFWPLLLITTLLIVQGMGRAAPVAAPAAKPSSSGPVGQATVTAPATEELDWAEMARELGNPATRTETLDELHTVQPFPAAAWVALLDHADLAVRLGALEVLEDLAGSDLNYDPWESDAAERAPSLARWRSWAATGAGKAPTLAAGAALQPEQLRDYLQDILAGDAAKAGRAMTKLRPYAAQAIGEIEQFLNGQSALQEGARGRLKEAQYRLLLESTAVNDAARLARLLVFGNRDERVEGLEGITSAGKRAIPILREMLQDREAQVREKAVDGLFLVKNKPALAIIESHLQTEKDENVIHAAVRGFGKVESPVGTRLLTRFLNHESEDLVAAALLSLGLQKQAAQAAKSQINACLKHPSWRVRAAALQCATKAQLGSAGPEVTALLSDKDSFVRQAAVLAVAAGARNDGSRSYGISGAIRNAIGNEKQAAVDALCKAFEQDDELKGTVLKAFASLEQPVPDRILEQFPKLSPELLAFGLSSLNPQRDAETDLLIRYATHENPDIACPALRVLARYQPENNAVQALLTKVLTSSDTSRKEAILERLYFSGKTRASGKGAMDKALAELAGEGPPAASVPAPAPVSPVAPPSTQTKVDRMYAAFLGEETTSSAQGQTGDGTGPAPSATGLVDRLHAAFLGDGDSPAPEKTSKPPGTDAALPVATPPVPGQPRTLHEALNFVAASAAKPSGENAILALPAARLLVEGGFEEGPLHYLRWWPDLNVQHRAELAEALHKSPQPGSLKLWQMLLRDPSREIRRKAVESAFYEEKVPVPIKLVFMELNRKEAVLEAADVYQSRLESMVSDRETRSMMAEHARLLGQDSRPDRQVLASIMLREKSRTADDEILQRAVVSPYFWVRRAAARSLGKRNKGTLDTLVPSLSKDASAWVREALPAALMETWPWEHHFDDNTAVEDEGSGYSESTSSRSLSEPALAALRELAKDREKRVRLAAMTALLMNREEVQLPTYIELLDRAPNRKELAKMLARFVEKQYQRLGKGLLPLLEHMSWDHVSEDRVEGIQKHFGLVSSDTKNDFAAYATEAGRKGPAQPASAQPQFVDNGTAAAEEDHDTPRADAAKAPVTVLFFHNPGCHECEKVRKELQSLARVFTGLKVQEHNIREPEAVVLNEALSRRFNVPPGDRLKTPAVFLQSGVLITDEISHNTLYRGIWEVIETGDSGLWHQIQTQEMAEAKKDVEARVQTLQPAVIFFAGLLDGVNPCAFATIIFLLSYLQVARRTSREILLVGGAFIFGVFITYFVLGLGLVEVVSRLTALQTIGQIVNWLLALGCLVVAVMSWRDARLAREGRLQDMTLQLPSFLKDRIRGVIRTGTRMNRFVLAAFASGAVISVLELACTGQVYLPTIVYAMNTGVANAKGFLLVYNVAFILPLVAVFGLAWGGLRSEALIQFQQRHTATVKYALAILFAVLFVALVWSGRL